VARSRWNLATGVVKQCLKDIMTKRA
jgi:hypothetical protein